MSIEWHARVDYDTRIALVVLRIVAHRIERRAPAAMDNVDLIAWIATRAHGPNDVVYVGRVDVIIHDDCPAIAISPSVAMRCHHAGLFGVSAIELLDGHR